MKPLIDLRVPPNSPTISINHAIKQVHISQRMRRKLRTNGIITINDQKSTWHALLHANDHITITLPAEQTLAPYPLPLTIIYEDEYILVINKPAGLLMHPTAKERHKTLANALVYYYQKRQQNYDFHPVHRLDKDTSGLVIIAKTAVVQHAFEKQNIKFQKVYDAIIEGTLTASIAIHWPIARKEGSIIERCVHKTGKTAHTDVVILANYDHYTHVRCLLHTGRTHQIRVHLASLGYPLLGDDIYGGHLNLIQRQALHASEIYFLHPILKKYIHLKGPLPHDMTQLLSTGQG